MHSSAKGILHKEKFPDKASSEVSVDESESDGQ
jgi:hypothetical protein